MEGSMQILCGSSAELPLVDTLTGINVSEVSLLLSDESFFFVLVFSKPIAECFYR